MSLHLLQGSVAFASDKSDTINIIYISKLMLKVFSIRKLMQNTDVNTLDGDNQLHLIFYLHQYFIISGKTDVRFIVISLLFPETNIIFYRHNTDVIININIC
jgi:hypothetical protein